MLDVTTAEQAAYLVAAALGLGAGVLDVLTTLRAFSLGLREANPIIIWLIGQVGVMGALLGTKVVLHAGILAGAAYLIFTGEQWYWAVFLLASPSVAYYAAWRNSRLIKKKEATLG